MSYDELETKESDATSEHTFSMLSNSTGLSHVRRSSSMSPDRKQFARVTSKMRPPTPPTFPPCSRDAKNILRDFESESGRGGVTVMPHRRESLTLTSEAGIQASRLEADRVAVRKLPDSFPLESYSCSVIDETEECSLKSFSVKDDHGPNTELSNTSLISVGSGDQQMPGVRDSCIYCELPTKFRLTVEKTGELEIDDVITRETRDHEQGEGHAATLPQVARSLAWFNVRLPRADRPGRRVTEEYSLCLDTKADHFPDHFFEQCHGHLHNIDKAAACPFVTTKEDAVKRNQNRTKLHWYSETRPATTDVIPPRKSPSDLSMVSDVTPLAVEGSNVDLSKQWTPSETVTSEAMLQRFTDKADWKFVMNTLDNTALTATSE